jgi:para-nitrobenzyl esterase
MSEDCLTLNVWVPRHSRGERLPVMVLIHGGGFFVGGSAEGEPSNEVALAAQGVIVASMNYRLGVFGFLSHPDLSKESTSGTSGNYGLLDQIAALSWLKANVDAFGGDANRVTIFGTSAGGSSVLYLMASPLARGLFNAAIAQSSANVFFPLRYRNRAAFAYEPAEIAGLRLSPNIEALRALSVAELLSRVPPPAIEPSEVDYWPTVDGHVLPEHPADLFERGAVARVPLIVGNTTDEGTLFAALHPVKTVAAWRELAQRRYPQAATDLLEQYPARSDSDLFGVISRYVTDWVFAGTTRGVARAMANHSESVWRYEFTRVNPRTWPPLDRPMGAMHSSEFAYVFGEPEWWPPQRPSPYDEADRALARTMSAAWVRFAKTGDPNGGDLPAAWPRYTRNDERRLAFGDSIAVGPEPNRVALDVYDRAFEKMRAGTSR